MKKNIIFSIVLLFVFLSACAQSLTFKNTEKDRGQTQWYQPISATFRFVNTSGEPLYIEEVDPGCACLAPEYPQGTIQPDEEGKIVITYNGATYPNEYESDGGPALGEPIPQDIPGTNPQDMFEDPILTDIDIDITPRTAEGL